MQTFLCPYSIEKDSLHAGGQLEYNAIITDNIKYNDKINIFHDGKNEIIGNIHFLKVNLIDNFILRLFIKIFPLFLPLMFLKNYNNYIKSVKKSEHVTILYTEFALIKLLFLFKKNIKFTIVMIDIFSLAIHNKLNFKINYFKKIWYYFLYTQIYLIEIFIVKIYDEIIVYSSAEKDFLLNRFNICPNKIIVRNLLINDLRYLKKDKEFDICFCANFNRDVNLYALEWFILKVLKNLKDLNIKVQIVGVISTENKMKFQKLDNRIYITGFVENVITEISKSKIIIAPIFVTGGIFKRIIDSLSLGIPVITTSLGARSFDLELQKSLLISDNEQDFQLHIDNLLNSDHLYNEQILKLNKNFNH